MIDLDLKRTLINDYLTGGYSYRGLGKKYGISHGNIHRWVLSYQQQEEAAQQAAAQTAILHTMNEEARGAARQEVSSPAVQIQELQKQLAQERLHNKLLTAMIDIAEEELKIPIRKKYGTRQSKK